MLPSQQSYLRYLDDVVTQLERAGVELGGFPNVRQHLVDAEVIVPVIGGFSAGKSTLLNSMLGRDLLPVGITPETELATELRFAKDEHLVAWRIDGSTERMDLGSITSIKGRAGEFTHLQAFVDNPFLEQHPEVVLVDMPGFGSSFANHDKAVAHYLPQGAHFIVVTSVEAGNLTQSITRHLATIHGLGRSLSFVVSKTNLRAPDDVNAVVGEVEDQVLAAFDNGSKVVPMDGSSGEAMRQLVHMLDADAIMRDAFAPVLKGETMSALARINSAEAAFHRTEDESRLRQEELEWSLKSIERKRDSIIQEVRGSRVNRAIDRCMKELTRELDQAQSELVQAAISGNNDAFGGIMGQITRGVVDRVMQAELREASKTVACAIADAIKPTDVSSGHSSLGSELVATVERGLNTASTTLTSWTTAVSNRNVAEIERIKSEKGTGTGQTIPRATYQGLATVLAVTTSIVNPAIELLIIFLPTIVGWINESRAREDVRQRISNEVIPAYVRDLRAKLPGIVEEQVEALVGEVTMRFEEEIGAQQQLVAESLSLSADAAGKAASALELLAAAREAIKRTANGVLYSEVAA